MTITSERLKELRKEKGKTMREVAQGAGLTVSALSNYENAIREPSGDALDALADYYNVDLDYLRGRRDEPNMYDFTGIYNAGYSAALKSMAAMTKVPVYDPVSCGTGTWVNEEPDSTFYVPGEMTRPGVSYFANPAQGDSMEPGIKLGDLLIFEQSNSIESGLIGAFALNGHYYCKRFKKLPDGSCWLFSDNTAYDPIPIAPGDDFRTLGIYKLRLSKEQ